MAGVETYMVSVWRRALVRISRGGKYPVHRISETERAPKSWRRSKQEGFVHSWHSTANTNGIG